MSLISDTDELVKNYNSVLDDLMQQFRDRAAGDTLVVVHRIWEGTQGIKDKGNTFLSWSCQTYSNVHNAVDDLDLNSMPYVWGAGLDTQKISSDGARKDILDEITTWINNIEDRKSRVFWLSGTGKSSIAHTIGLRFRKLGRLGSCYCFSRSEINQQRHKKIFTTIARDLADNDDNIRRELVAAIRLNTWLKNTADILQQWKELIMKPAKKLSEAIVGPIVIIIDALDESGEADSRQHLLRILAGKLDDDECRISKLPPHFRILLTSQPLPDITDALDGVEHVQRKSMDNIPSMSNQWNSHRHHGLSYMYTDRHHM